MKRFFGWMVVFMTLTALWLALNEEKVWVFYVCVAFLFGVAFRRCEDEPGP